MKTRLLKCIPANRITRNGFAWPKRGTVECPVWDPRPRCGGGLHAWRWIPGDDPNCIDYHSAKDCVWLVVEALESDIVDLDGKCKFRCGRVVFSGSFVDAVARLKRPIDCAGFNGTATARGYGTATAGDCGTATAGDYGTATAGDCGTATAGDYGTAIAGDCGTATAGDCGTAIAGNGGTATAGDYGTAIAGNSGTATAGDCGTAIAGGCGTVTAGDYGVICIDFLDKANGHWARRVAVAGENGIEAGKRYKLDDFGRFIEVAL